MMKRNLGNADNMLPDQTWRAEDVLPEEVARLRGLLREAFVACRMSNQLAGAAPLALFDVSPLAARIRQALGEEER